jgi:hypothetical protein
VQIQKKKKAYTVVHSNIFIYGQVRRCMLAVPAFGILRKKVCEFEANPNYIERPISKVYLHGPAFPRQCVFKNKNYF